MRLWKEWDDPVDLDPVKVISRKNHTVFADIDRTNASRVRTPTIFDTRHDPKFI